MSFAYYRWFPGDYARDTAHLTMLQHAAYRHLIDAYMATGKPIRGDLNAICRICGALSGDERQAVDFVLCEFFLMDGPLWRNARCDRELEYLMELSKAGRKAAQSRWNATVLRSHYDGNANQNQNQTRSKPSPASDNDAGACGGFREFWNAYPRKRDKADAEKVWRQLKPSTALQQEILNAIAKAKRSDLWLEKNGRYIKYPAGWLRAHGWKDELPEPAVKQKSRLL